jgi:glycosyltransferase involved in cell wall biosynthesis
MKILIISPTVNGIGGIAQNTRDLIKFLKEHGHDVDVLSSENTPIINIKKLKNPSFLISSFLKTKMMKKYDIIHSQHPIGSMAMKNLKGKKIVTFHGIYNQQIGILHGKSSSKISNKLENNAIKYADAVTTGSKESFNFYQKFGQKVTFIPNGIDIDALPTETDTRYEKQIIFVGRLSKEKGIETILKAAKTLPADIDLLIVGNGPEENNVKKTEIILKNVHYLGYLPKEQTIPLIRGSKLLIQPSYAEGISSTLLEAMATKTPVIASNVGGNIDLFENNESGILIEPGNSTCLLNEIISLLNDPIKLNKLSESAFKTVQKYNWKNIGQQYLTLYEKLLKI